MSSTNFRPAELTGRTLKLHPIPGHGWIGKEHQTIAVPPDFNAEVVASFLGGPRPILVSLVVDSISAFAGLWCIVVRRGDEDDLRVGITCNIVLFKDRPPDLTLFDGFSQLPPFEAAGFAIVRLPSSEGCEPGEPGGDARSLR